MPTLLAILAHPDDESFGPGGTLAKYAREGVEVHVCIATDGGEGAYDPTFLATSGHGDLAALRRAELECACHALNVTLHRLDYGDSGMGGAESNDDPNCLTCVAIEDVAQRIVDLIAELRPEVIITHGPTGDYFHPDHIRVHQSVMAALQMERVREIKPLRVYYAAIPYAQMKWMIRLLRLLRKGPHSVR